MKVVIAAHQQQLLVNLSNPELHYRLGLLMESIGKRAEAIELMLQDFGIEEERFRLEWVSASEGPRFAQVVTEMVKKIKELGPSPYKT